MKPSILSLVLLCLLSGALARAEPYQIVTEEWAPYNYEDNGQLTGMSTEVVRAIMALTGDDFEIDLLPTMRATYALQNRPNTIMLQNLSHSWACTISAAESWFLERTNTSTPCYGKVEFSCGPYYRHSPIRKQKH